MSTLSKTALLTQINTLLADNTTGDITASDLRSVLTDIVDSYPDIQVASGTLTSAQIKALHTTPITLISAPGAGIMLQPLAMRFFLDFETTAYTGSYTLRFKYNSSTASYFSVDSTYVNSVADYLSVLPDKDTKAYVNDAFVVDSTAAISTGNSPIKYKIYYALDTF